MEYFVDTTRSIGDLERLTPREVEVALRVAQGLTNREIAGELSVGFRTIDTHVANVMAKLSVGRRSQVATLVERAGLLAADEPDPFGPGREITERQAARGNAHPSHRAQ